jgi:hypothetical protein
MLIFLMKTKTCSESAAKTAPEMEEGFENT